jgi:hypothetical protein
MVSRVTSAALTCKFRVPSTPCIRIHRAHVVHSDRSSHSRPISQRYCTESLLFILDTGSLKGGNGNLEMGKVLEKCGLHQLATVASCQIADCREHGPFRSHFALLPFPPCRLVSLPWGLSPYTLSPTPKHAVLVIIDSLPLNSASHHQILLLAQYLHRSVRTHTTGHGPKDRVVALLTCLRNACFVLLVARAETNGMALLYSLVEGRTHSLTSLTRVTLRIQQDGLSDILDPTLPFFSSPRQNLSLYARFLA